METTKLPPSSPSSPTSFSVPSAEKVDGFPRRSMRRARQRRSHSSSQFRYQSSQVELTPLPLLKGETLFILPGRSIKGGGGWWVTGGGGTMIRINCRLKFKDESQLDSHPSSGLSLKKRSVDTLFRNVSTDTGCLCPLAGTSNNFTIEQPLKLI